MGMMCPEKRFGGMLVLSGVYTWEEPVGKGEGIFALSDGIRQIGVRTEYTQEEGDGMRHSKVSFAPSGVQKGGK